MWEKKAIDGIEYHRNTDFGKVWMIEDYKKHPEPSIPHVVCECGCTLFRIWTASYDTWAYCSQCGHGESIHSG